MPGGGGGRVDAWVGTVNADTPSMDKRNSFARFGSHPSTSVGTPPGPEPSPCPGAEPSPCPGATTKVGTTNIRWKGSEKLQGEGVRARAGVRQRRKLG